MTAASYQPWCNRNLAPFLFWILEGSKRKKGDKLLISRKSKFHETICISKLISLSRDNTISPQLETSRDCVLASDAESFANVVRRKNPNVTTSKRFDGIKTWVKWHSFQTKMIDLGRAKRLLNVGCLITSHVYASVQWAYITLPISGVFTERC